MMSRNLVMGVVAGLFCGALLSPTFGRAASDEGPLPNFTPDSSASWVPDRLAGDDFLPPPSGPGPVMAMAPMPEAKKPDF
jgi:hypothetical protein